MSGVEKLARVLHDQGCEAGYSCDVLHRSERYALPETWGRMAERILADPGPLLAALSEAGVLGVERLEWVRDAYGEAPLEAVGEISDPYWKRRYVTEWTADD